MVTIWICILAPACFCRRACSNSMASVTTSAIISSTSRPVTIQMMVQTAVDGSVLVVSDRIRKEISDISTEADTTTNPSTRSGWLVRANRLDRRGA